MRVARRFPGLSAACDRAARNPRLARSTAVGAHPYYQHLLAGSLHIYKQESRMASTSAALTTLVDPVADVVDAVPGLLLAILQVRVPDVIHRAAAAGAGPASTRRRFDGSTRRFKPSSERAKQNHITALGENDIISRPFALN